MIPSYKHTKLNVDLIFCSYSLCNLIENLLLSKINFLKILIIDNYDSFVYNLVQLVEQAGSCEYLIRKNDNILQLDQSEFDKVLISPGPGIASEAGDLLEFIRKHYQDKSMLGICLGHEAIAEVFGSTIRQLPEPMHGIRTNGYVSSDHYIFKGLPKEFMIGHYHSWILDEEKISNALNIFMRDDTGLIMAFNHEKYDATGLMFHPESIMTEYGFEMIRNWIRYF